MTPLDLYVAAVAQGDPALQSDPERAVARARDLGAEVCKLLGHEWMQAPNVPGEAPGDVCCRCGERSDR